MESAKDSIKYIKPVFSKTHINELDLNDKHTLYGREDDPWGYDAGKNFYNSQNMNEKDVRKAMYETTEDRATGELINFPASKIDTNKVIFKFKAEDNDVGAITSGANATEKEAARKENVALHSKKWKEGKALIRGYTVIYGKDERDVIAVEEKRTKEFLLSNNYKDDIESIAYNTDNTLEIEFKSGKLPANVSAMARCDLEDDFEGDSLGEVELVLTDFDFKPRPTTIGVTWSQMAEITLDASFGVSTQELLVQYAAEAIRVNLDYRAFKLAYLAAKTNNDAHYVVFDAAYGGATKEGYIHNAQTFCSAIDTLSDNMLNEIKISLIA